MARIRSVRLLIVLCSTTVASSQAQTFTSLASFTFATGIVPRVVTLAQGLDGNFYGTTSEDGPNSRGTVFSITPGGTLNVLYGFDINHGAAPWSGVILAPNGNFYGATLSGGQDINGRRSGTVYSITAAGAITTLHSFAFTDGAAPYGPVMQATTGDFYGATAYGAISASTCPPYNTCGTIFKITAQGTLTTMHKFTGGDGANPYGGLLQASDGIFYGTTGNGGANGCTLYGGTCGTVFKMTADGVLTVLHKFTGSDGSNPQAGLVEGSDGNFYGTTFEGGAYSDGTVFKITPAGVLTTLYSFAGASDGQQPYAPLIQATDKNFYGTASNGVIFQITPSGVFTILYTVPVNGDVAMGGLLQGTDGNFYGTSDGGIGSTYYGTVYRLSTGLGPFVVTLPHVGRVGASVMILGSNLTGTSSVNFNGVPAAFTVVSATELTATVPADATSGTLQVATPGGILSSNVPFRVRP